MPTPTRTSLALVVLLTAACGDNQATPAPSSTLAPNAAATSTAPGAGATGNSPMSQRRGELINPDDSTMVFLYYDLARLSPPIDSWVEEDRRVRSAPGPDKAAKRTAVRTELEAGAAGVRDAGTIRLTMNAKLSDYDPTYEEFTVRALSPSSTVTYSALGQEISMRFANGNDAQVWRVPKAASQLIRDRIGYSGASLDALLQIAAVQPAPAGGTIVVNVVEYELRENRGGATLGRVRIGGK
ncbi:MAG: hypothetical protein SXG53_17305 [Pseudomonadota bacterium]|nr:hypothetical protein [Pseudomonadota bacterium]